MEPFFSENAARIAFEFGIWVDAIISHGKILITAAFGLGVTHYSTVLDNPEGRSRLLARLRTESDIREAYRNAIHKLLSWITWATGDEGTASGGRTPAWSTRSFDWTLRLAMIYPLLAALAGWVIIGDLGSSGNILGLPTQDATIPRVLTGIGIIAILIAIVISAATKKRRFTIGATVFTLIIASFFAGLQAIVITIAFTASFLFAIRIDRMGSGMLFWILALTSAIVIANVSIPLTLASLFVSLLAFSLLLVMRSKRGIGWLSVSFVLIALLVISFGAASITRMPADPSPQQQALIATTLVFFGAIPLVNAVFDWASIGLTRILLGWGATTANPVHHLIVAFLDFVAAIVSMIALIIVLAFTLETMNLLTLRTGGSTLFPILGPEGVLESVRRAPDAPEHAWMYFVFLSTLIPTAVHGMIAFFGLITAAPPFRSLVAILVTHIESHIWNRTIPAAILSTFWLFGAALVVLTGFIFWQILASTWLWLSSDTSPLERMLEIVENSALLARSFVPA